MKNSRFFSKSVAFVLAATLGAGILPFSESADAGPDARSIMDKVATTRKLDGSEAVIKMTIVDEGGQKRERELSMATKLFDGGKTEKRIYRFNSPTDVKGTGILVFDNADKADDVWVFLPALRKTRRIVSSQQTNSFMGSEFSYGDLNVPALDDFTYKIEKEESYDGEACFVIEVLPKSAEIGKAEGYSKKIYWVSKDKYVVRQGHYFDAGGKLVKELKTKDIALLDKDKKRYRAKTMQMVNKVNNRQSTFETVKLAFVPDAKDEFFTERYLERQ
jgi:Outer membrane lipoprotein-sorting protein